MLTSLICAVAAALCFVGRHHDNDNNNRMNHSRAVVPRGGADTLDVGPHTQKH